MNSTPWNDSLISCKIGQRISISISFLRTYWHFIEPWCTLEKEKCPFLPLQHFTLKDHEPLNLLDVIIFDWISILAKILSNNKWTIWTQELTTLWLLFMQFRKNSFVILRSVNLRVSGHTKRLNRYIIKAGLCTWLLNFGTFDNRPSSGG